MMINMTKVYIVISKLDGCPTSILCVKTKELETVKYMHDYAKKYKLDLYYANTPEEFYANDSEIIEMVEKELDD